MDIFFRIIHDKNDRRSCADHLTHFVKRASHHAVTVCRKRRETQIIFRPRQSSLRLGKLGRCQFILVLRLIHRQVRNCLKFVKLFITGHRG